MHWRPGPLNLITDVDGLRVGNAHDTTLKSGVSVLRSDVPFTTGVHVMGGAPGTRETDLLAPDKLVEQVDALVLSGGSAFGLDAASGVAEGLRAIGRGFPVGDQVVPVVPAAIVFDLLNGGDKAWEKNPYSNLGRLALARASTVFRLGTEGAGTGAITADLKGGLGSASLNIDGYMVGALVVVNALGSAMVGDGPHFWAAPFEMREEFGGMGPAPHFPAPDAPKTKLAQHANTTIGIVATDAPLTQAQCTRMAIAAHDGFARALMPAHTPMDGDLIFGVSTGTGEVDVATQLNIGHAAATCMARAIARGVYEATKATRDTLPCWQDKFGTKNS